VLGSAVAGGLVETAAGEVRLSATGREYALHVIRTHRLWERFLADRTGLQPSEWHEEAERREHQLTPEQTRRLADRMGRPAYDPHGDPIPEADGTLPPLEGVPVTALEPGQTAEIVHIEDEPRPTYLRLLDAGLAPGMRLTITERSPDGSRFVAAGRSHHVRVEDGGSLEVRALEGARAEGEYGSLADLGPGRVGRVLGISAACQGPQRRRLLDLGVVPGTEISADLAGAFGDPVAYRIRGALIALRREQASWVLVETAEAGVA
jgi:DtxR family Mn-dependent transcriptional regulator